MNRVATRVLLVEDHPRMVQAIVPALAAAGLACDAASSTAQADASLKSLPYAALALDRGLPDGDGLAWLKRLRGAGHAVPCLVLTARDALHDRIDGLEAGADDYLSKPFAMDELVARVRALLRRPPQWAAPVHEWAGVKVDAQAATMAACGGAAGGAGAAVSLASSELQLMLALVVAQGRTLRRAELEAAAWGLSEAVTPNALDVALHRLRRKLQLIEAPAVLVNTKGVGYAMVAAAGGNTLDESAGG